MPTTTLPTAPTAGNRSIPHRLTGTNSSATPGTPHEFPGSPPPPFGFEARAVSQPAFPPGNEASAPPSTASSHGPFTRQRVPPATASASQADPPQHQPGQGTGLVSPRPRAEPAMASLDRRPHRSQRHLQPPAEALVGGSRPASPLL